MAPLEPYEKVLVSPAFLDTDHGEMSCPSCHGGDESAMEREAAHVGVVRDPTIRNAQGTCGECHDEIVETGVKSLHATLSTFSVVLKSRSGDSTWSEVDGARKNHCAGCHSSCGQCHVSRPKFAKNGFINGHLFSKRPSMTNQCTACHGSRVGDEYFGDRGSGDVHMADGGMDCMDCHGAEEMHASGEGLKSRYELPEMPTCKGCHEDLKGGGNKQHNLHVGKLQCQVCHAQEYVNCYSCHIGKDKEGLAYFQNRKEVETFKIGKAYPGAFVDGTFTLVRHVPSDPEAFDYYKKGAFPEFGSTPTWKRASPHNIRRSTWQNSNCNHCHGQRDIFLADSDLLDYEKAANASVVIADDEVPKARKDVEATPPVAVVSELLVSAGELHELMAGGGVVVIDARPVAAYKQDHVKGAISFDAARNLRYGPKHEKAMQMKNVAELAGYAGELGLDGSERVVIYDAGGLRGTLLFLALERIGHKKASILDGGIEGWEEAGYHTAHGDPPAVAATTFPPQADDSIMVSNEKLSSVLGQPDTVVLDVRSIAQHMGVRKHTLAAEGGAIKGSTNLSVRTLWSVEGFMKAPEVMAWVLAGEGITPEKTVITTCNTSQLASGAYFALRYLGYGKVKVHDGSWVSWEQSGQKAAVEPARTKSAATAMTGDMKEEEEEEEEMDFGC